MDAILLGNQDGEGENEQENDDMAALHAYQNVLPMISALIRRELVEVTLSNMMLWQRTSFTLKASGSTVQ